MRANISKKKMLELTEYSFGDKLLYAGLLSYNKDVQENIQANAELNHRAPTNQAFINGFMHGYDDAMNDIKERLNLYFNKLVKSEVKRERTRVKEIMRWLNE